MIPPSPLSEDHRFSLPLPEEEVYQILRAFDFAYQAHQGQTRQSGEPYFLHPLEVAEILSDLEMDTASIVAALLHDVVEDCGVPLEKIEKEFGKEVASLVDGVTKLKLADFDLSRSEEAFRKKRDMETRRRAENLRKIFLAMARDIRVMIIKLADRLHNMRTLWALPEDRQKKIAEETLQIYAPLAHRLGIWTIKWQLEDLAFKYLYPKEFAEIAEKVARTRREREQQIEEAIQILAHRLQQNGISAVIQGRPKHLWSIYQKMLKQEIPFEGIYDLTALRVIVHTVPECYQALGIVHDLWIPIPGMFSDYIAHPKSNMYQSLHTKVLGPGNEPLEVQIRTFEMHRTAEFGVAAHWRYKEGGTADEFERKLAWLRQQMFEWQTDSLDSGDFLRSVTEDLFADQVFVFTPKGDVIDLPAGSTPVDFAYRIHSDIGDTCVGAKVNGRIVPLNTPLRNGDIVEIIRRTGASPSLDWLSFVKSSHARSKIKAYFRKLRREENIALGRELLEREAERLGREPLKEEEIEKAVELFNLASEEDLLAAIGAGNISAATVFHRIQPMASSGTAVPTEAGPLGEGRLDISAGGVAGILVRRARCCQPLPGDAVVGYVSRGRGLVLHRDDCPNVQLYREREPDRIIAVDWKYNPSERYQATLKITAMDRVGLLNDISAVFAEEKTNIQSARVSSDPKKRIAVLELTLDVPNAEVLNQLIIKVSKLSDVLEVYRVTGGGKNLPA